MALLSSPWGHKELGMTEQLSFNLSCWYSPPNNGGHGDILRFCSTCAFFSQIMNIVLIGRYWSLFSSIGILLIESESALNCVTGCQYSILPVLCTVSTKISKTRFLLSISLWGHWACNRACICSCCSVARSHLTLCDPVCYIAHQASLSFTVSQSLLRFMSIELAMLSNHLILCCPLLLLPSVFPSIRISSSESALWISWPKYWNFSFSISPSNEYSGLISFRTDWCDLVV